MDTQERSFRTCCERARCGDSAARAEVNRYFDSYLVYVVRRVLRQGTGSSCLDRHILTQAERLRLEYDVAPHSHPEPFIRMVADCVSDYVLERMHSSSTYRFEPNETLDYPAEAAS